ncbi:hypothetical protein RUND412_007891 [Rhizina undulata]
MGLLKEYFEINSYGQVLCLILISFFLLKTQDLVSSEDHRAEVIHYVLLITLHHFDLDAMERHLLFELAIHIIYNVIEYTIENHVSLERQRKLNLVYMSRQNPVEPIRFLASFYFLGSWSGCIKMIWWEKCRWSIVLRYVEGKIKRELRVAKTRDEKQFEHWSMEFRKELAQARHTTGNCEIALDALEKCLDEIELVPV